ncbi:MAG: hypothetical protein ABIT83_10940 [Massilia sp.]
MTRPWRLSWDHGSAEVQPLGGMLGPVSLRLGGDREIDIMHVAPWAGMTDAAALPGIMRRLRGEWPCVPFGRTDRPSGLPEGWQVQTPSDHWTHGYAANHRWHCVEASERRVHVAIEYPATSAVSRIERVIAAGPDSPALDISLTIWTRRPTRMPAGLHPTFRLPPAPGRVKLMLGAHDGVHSYPAHVAGATSRLLADTRSDSLSKMAAIDAPLDLSRLPLAAPTEELMQVKDLAGVGAAPPFALHYLDYDACVGMWWDTAKLPDLMLWVSNGGRIHFPWMSRHLALGAEPVNSLFDLGRVARAPEDHPLAGRLGIELTPDEPWHTRYRIAAWPQSAKLST